MTFKEEAKTFHFATNCTQRIFLLIKQKQIMKFECLPKNDENCQFKTTLFVGKARNSSMKK